MTTARSRFVPSPSTLSQWPNSVASPGRRRASGPDPLGERDQMRPCRRDSSPKPMRSREAADPAYRPGPRGEMAQNGAEWLTSERYLPPSTRKLVQSTSERPAPFRSIPVHSYPSRTPLPSYAAPSGPPGVIPRTGSTCPNDRGPSTANRLISSGALARAAEFAYSLLVRCSAHTYGPRPARLAAESWR